MSNSANVPQKNNTAGPSSFLVSSSDDNSSKLHASANSNTNNDMDKFSNVKLLDYKDVEKAVVTLIEAFSTDSLAELLASDLKSSQLKKDFEVLLYTAYLRQHISKGIVLGINESSECFETVAIWSHPDSIGQGLDSFTTLMESGYGKLWNSTDEITREKVFHGMLPLLHDTFEHIISNDTRFRGKGAFTLVYLGSTKNARGKGNVRKIFDYMFANYVDLTNSNHICYLESSAASNIPIYERFGFKFYKDIMLGSKSENSIEGRDYALMNVMIRDSFGNDWTKDPDSPLSKF